jgi:hypothetical protein
MTTYVRLTQDKLAVEKSDIELSAQEFAALVEWKQSFMRLYVVDAAPVPSASQVVEAGVPLITPTEYHATWVLREKTADELEAEALNGEKAQLVNWLDDVQTQLNLDNAARALLTNAQRINELEKDTRVLLKVAKRYVRQQKRAI